MTNTEIKLILLDYKEFHYVPELGGYWMLPNIIFPFKVQLNDFSHKYKIFTITKEINYLNFRFYMNLLNFNNYSDWIISDWKTMRKRNNISSSFHRILINELFDNNMILDICRVFNNVYI